MELLPQVHEANSLAPMNLDHLAAGRHLLPEALPDRWVVVFARVSTGDQVREGGSLSHQIDAGLTMARKNQRVVSAVYVDPGKSATKLGFDQRAGIRQLLEDVRQGRVSVIYVYKRDRVARQSGEWFHFLKTCQRHKAKIVFTCPHEPPVGTGIYGKVQEAFMSLWAELEAEQIRIRVKDSLVKRFQDGEWVGGALPFGLARGPFGDIVPHEDEVLIVQEIFAWAVRDKWGAKRISTLLNSRGAIRRGFLWTPSSVSSVLRSKVYCGYLSLETELEADDEQEHVRWEKRSTKLPEIIPEEVWEQAQEIRKSRHYVRNSPPSPFEETPNLLNGLLFCGTCGQPMATKRRSNRHTNADGTEVHYQSRHYHCRTRGSTLRCAGQGGIRADDIEEVVLAVCVEHILRRPPSEFEEVALGYHAEVLRQMNEECAAVRRIMGRTQAALDRNGVALRRAERVEDARFHEARITELNLRRRDEEDRLLTLEERRRNWLERRPAEGSEVALSWAEFADRLSEIPFPLVRAFVSEMVGRVTFDHDGRTVDIVLRLPEISDDGG